MNFKELIENRYSCRKFSEKKVDLKLLEEIIEAGNKAPTAVNHQPFKIFLINSEEAKQNIRKATGYTFGADIFIIIGSKEKEGWVRSFDKQNFADIDASIVATHIMLKIYEMGLATTWVGYFDVSFLKTTYPNMKEYNLIALFPIGYEAEDSKPSSYHYQRKNKEEILELL
jgi:nitroreductase